MTFTIWGTPVAKGRPKLSTRGGFARAYTPEKTINYENLVKVMFKAQGGEKMDGTLGAVISFYFPIPQSVSKKLRKEMATEKVPHTKKPDIDNCIKSLFDGLNGLAFDDDKQIAFIMVDKKYSENPRTVVDIFRYERRDDNDTGAITSGTP